MRVGEGCASVAGGDGGTERGLTGGRPVADRYRGCIMDRVDVGSMPSRRHMLAAAAAALLAVLTVAVVLADGPLPGEVALIERWQAIGPPIPAVADAVLTVTGTEATLVIGAVPAVWLVVRHGRRGLAAVLIILAAMLVVQPLSKELVDRERPSSDQVEVRATSTSESYPSGHALGTTAVWGTAALYVRATGRRTPGLLLVFPIVATGVASVVQGVHWASDVVAGAIIGGFAAWLAVGALELTRSGPSRRDRLVR
jgi:membrane-associated phospholipid phosphatase